jgi:chemosensory pili system protein ChpB (putative protein-glutamate methylesterase)
VFNDAQVSSNLSGWDHARWARNLAAKILRRPEISTPPRPPGAESVPTPVQKSASFVPIAEKPGEHAAHAPRQPGAPVLQQAAKAPSEPVARRSETPTVELPLPVIAPEVIASEVTASEPVAETGGLDIAALSEFAQLIEPAPVEPDHAELKPAAASQSAADFAAELDALFAAADGAGIRHQPAAR